MKRAFTLIELLVIIAIMGLMVTVGIVSVRSGQGAARVKGATRDVYAAIRHARSTALVTGQRVIVNYSNEMVDGEVMAKVEVVAAKIMGVDPDHPEYGWHRVGVRVHQEAAIVADAVQYT